MATKKKQSFACKLRLFFKSYAFFVGLPIVLMTIALIGYVHLQIGNSRRAKAIYGELRNLVLKDKIVNITNIKRGLEERHGEIDENIWRIIDSHRIRDRDIGFLQDDFLYWKLLWSYFYHRINLYSFENSQTSQQFFWIWVNEFILKTSKLEISFRADASANLHEAAK